MDASTKLRYLPLVALSALLSACTITAPPLGYEKGNVSPEEFRQHVLMFDSRGGMHDPAAPGPTLDLAASDAYLQRMVDAIDAEHQGKPVHLLFFFHGGLNSRAAALDRAKRHILKIAAEQPDIYPIFVNWQTSLPASYYDHLFKIPKGHDVGKAALLLSPAQAATDLARTIAESPVAYYLHLKDRLYSYSFKDDDKVASIASQCRDPKLHFREGISVTPRPSDVRDAAQSALIFPLTALASGLIDAAGSSAWGAMIYTSDRLFWSPREVHRPYHYEPSEGGSGGLSRLLDRLATMIDKRRREHQPDTDITIVAHSAGAVVANKFVANYGKSLPIMKLVYMAPACTIDEIMPGGKLVQFLRQNGDRRLYILALHEKAELEEQHWFKIPPRGSLLVWLDEVIQPKSSEFTGMMLGRARNLRLHAHLIPCDVQDQVHITAYDDNAALPPDVQPQRHGDFGELHYWNPAAWEPNIDTLTPITFTRTPGTRP